MWLELNCQCFLNPLTVGNSRNLFGSFSLARLPGVFLVLNLYASAIHAMIPFKILILILDRTLIQGPLFMFANH